MHSFYIGEAVSRSLVGTAVADIMPLAGGLEVYGSFRGSYFHGSFRESLR